MFFYYPGQSHLIVFMITRRNIPSLQACVMISVIGFALANLIADFLDAALNPRIQKMNRLLRLTQISDIDELG